MSVYVSVYVCVSAFSPPAQIGSRPSVAPLGVVCVCSPSLWSSSTSSCGSGTRSSPAGHIRIAVKYRERLGYVRNDGGNRVVMS